MTAAAERPHGLRCAASTGSGPCMREVAYRIYRVPLDQTDYACKGHLGAVVKARLRGIHEVTVGRT